MTYYALEMAMEMADRQLNFLHNCPLCKRPLEQAAEEHHLIPRTFKGKETVKLHRICHRKIHSAITEREMEKYYHTIDRLLEHGEVQKFVKWVAKKAPDYYDVSRESSERKRKRNK